MTKKNPINESGEAYELFIKLAFELAKIDATIKKPFQNADPEIWPGPDIVIPDYTISKGQLLGYNDPLHVSSKGLSGPGSDYKRIFSHIDREIRAYPFKTVLVLGGDAWPEAVIVHAQKAIDYIKLEAVLLGPDKLYCWLGHRSKSMRLLKHKPQSQSQQMAFWENEVKKVGIVS